MIAYLFAVRHEGALFERQLQKRKVEWAGGVRCVVGDLGEQRIVCATLGMGPAQAARSVEAVLGRYPIQVAINAGYAGALVPQLRRGQIVVADNYTSEELQPPIRLVPDFNFARFCTAEEFAGDPETRARLAQQHHAQVVEMEGGAIAETLKAHNVAFAAVRVISDAVEDKIPAAAVMAGCSARTGRATPLRLAFHLLFHPHHLPAMIRTVLRLGPLRKRLTQFLLQLHEELPLFQNPE